MTSGVLQVIVRADQNGKRGVPYSENALISHIVSVHFSPLHRKTCTFHGKDGSERCVAQDLGTHSFSVFFPGLQVPSMGIKWDQAFCYGKQHQPKRRMARLRVDYFSTRSDNPYRTVVVSNKT